MPTDSPPPNVRTEVIAPPEDGPTYRTVSPGEELSIRVSGTTSVRARIFLSVLLTATIVSALAGSLWHPIVDALTLLLGAVTAHLGARVTWRTVRSVRLDLLRDHVVIHELPIGARARLSAAAARSPVVTVRTTSVSPVDSFPLWEMWGEGEDGKRVRLAVFADEESAAFVSGVLRRRYAARADEAVGALSEYLGPRPPRVWCDASPSSLGIEPWNVRLSFERPAWVRVGVAVALLSVSAGGVAVASVVASVAGTGAPILVLMLCAPLVLACFVGFDVLRDLAAAQSSGAWIIVSPDGLEVRVAPPLSWFVRDRVYGQVEHVVAVRSRRAFDRASLHVHTPSGIQPLLPGLAADANDVEYVARILEWYVLANRDATSGPGRAA